MKSVSATAAAAVVTSWLAVACSSPDERRSSPPGASSSSATASSGPAAGAGHRAATPPGGVRPLAAEQPSQQLWANRVNELGLASYQQLAAPLPGRDPGALVWYRDAGQLHLGFMRRADPEHAEEVFSLARQDELWSSPIAAQLAPPFRVRALADIATLSTGRAMLLAVGDDTDYEQIVGRSPDGGRAAISDAELTALQNQNRRLFASFALGAAWSKPLPIPGSLGVLYAALEAGPAQRAYALFVRDDDNAYDTLEDRDLYLAVFDGLRWREPIRLTDDPGREVSLEAAFIDGELITAWVRDGDADLTTTGDRLIYAATFSADGVPTRPPAPVDATLYERPRPILGALAGRPILLFAGNPSAAPSPSPSAGRPLLASRLDATWSTPAPTGLAVGNVARGALFPSGDATVLIYEDDNHLVAAVSRGGAWHSSGVVQDYNRSKFRLGEAAYWLDEQHRLWVAATGAENLGAPAAGQPLAAPAATLFHVQLPLAADLGVGDVLIAPRHLQLDEPATLRVPVENRGYRHSGPFDVTVTTGGETLASAHQEDGLYPGERRVVELSFAMARPQYRVTIAATAAATAPPELELRNNARELAVAVRPDFAVSSVERQGDTLIATVRELKGVITSPVNVDFVLVEGETRTALAQRTFDPSAAVPVTAEVPGLGARTSPYTISVRVNDRTSVIEDDHGNNLTTYAHRPGPDFVVEELAVTADEVRVVVHNRGPVAAASVAILLTANPELSASPAPIPGVAPIALEEVALVDGRATLQLPRSALDGHDGYFVYAVVNPYGAVAERDRDNNLRQVPRDAVEMAPPAGPRPPLYALRRLELAAGAVVSGDVAVRDAASSLPAPPRPSLELLGDARLDGSARADAIRLAAAARVAGAARYNVLDAEPGATIEGASESPLALPVLVQLPPLPSIVPGSERISVSGGSIRILPPGAYADVLIGAGASRAPMLAHLILSGGVYHLRSLKLGANARVTCAAACELRVAADIAFTGAASLGPVPGSQLGADKIRLFIAGGGLTAAAGSTLTADVMALAGPIRIGSAGRVIGRLAALEISLGAAVAVTGLAPPAVPLRRTPLGVSIERQARQPTRPAAARP